MGVKKEKVCTAKMLAGLKTVIKNPIEDKEDKLWQKHQHGKEKRAKALVAA